MDPLRLSHRTLPPHFSMCFLLLHLEPQDVLINKSAPGTRLVIFNTSLSEKEINLSLQFSRSNSHRIALSKSRLSMQSYRSCSLLSDLLSASFNVFIICYSFFIARWANYTDTWITPTLLLPLTASRVPRNLYGLDCLRLDLVVTLHVQTAGLFCVSPSPYRCRSNVLLYYRRGSSIASTTAIATIAPPSIRPRTLLGPLWKSVRL